MTNPWFLVVVLWLSVLTLFVAAPLVERRTDAQRWVDELARRDRRSAR